MEQKFLVFDMDGTIADLYGVNNWLDMLLAEDVTPYAIAKPLYNMKELNNLILNLKSIGYTIVVISWLSQGNHIEYDKKVKQVKKQWLEKYNFPYDMLHIVEYGTEKSLCTRKLKGYQILIDDNEDVRKNWKNGSTINANENIITELKKLLKE